MGLKETFKKQGGTALLKRYWQSGAFYTAVGEFLLLGKSRTALEILRLSAQLKAKQNLEKRYKGQLAEFEKSYDQTLPHEQSNKVWVCWFQGMDNAPDLVRKCYQSIRDNLEGREVVLITSDNMMDYVQFPDDIQKKVNAGIIRGAHLSDLLRLELLIKYGGTWIDATVFCSNGDIPGYMLDSDLFLFQTLKPGRDGHCIVISNWFITAKSNNRILGATQHLLYEYWKNNNDVIDYFIFHIFFQLVIEKYPDEWNKVVPFTNAVPHILLLRLYEDFDDKIWSAVNKMTPFHKLSYKLDEEKIQRKGSYYDEMFSGRKSE